MTLVPDPTEAGLWTNLAWTPGDPGVFALLIGVSRYDHLTDGKNPAPDTFDLGQLAVSALTAARFFEWLRAGYSLDGWPLASVRLLLSPQKTKDADELQGCDAGTVSHAPEATFENCKSAIENWYAGMQKVGASSSGRSLFFFSGHGLELRRTHQVLLPCNYLRPPTQPLNDAISTRNLMECLPSLPGVSSHMLFVDACRNDHQRLRGKKVEGADILNEDLVGATNPKFVSGVVHATASGLQAYQPKSNGISLFGHALLDGLKAKPDPVLDEAPIELRQRGNASIIDLDKLTSYVNRRLEALIKAAKETVVQTVRSDLDKPAASEIFDVAQVLLEPPPPPPSSPSLPSRPVIEVQELIRGPRVGGGTRLPGASSFDFSLPDPFPTAPTRSRDLPKRQSINKTRKKPSVRSAPPRRNATVKEREAWLGARYSAVMRPGPVPSDQAGQGDIFTHLHEALGAEFITDPWMRTLAVTDLATGKVRDHRAVKIVSSNFAKDNQALYRLQVHFRLIATDYSAPGCLLSIEDALGNRFACVLPYRDHAHEDPLYQLEIDIGPGPSDNMRPIMRFAAYLSTAGKGWLGRAATTWHRLRALSADEASRLIDPKQLEAIVERKTGSPIAATAAGIVLLRSNQLDVLRDWMRNLGNWFPWLPDGVVLWTEQSRRIAKRKGTPLDPAIVAWFVENLNTRSLPFTAAGLGFAADIADDMARGRIAMPNNLKDDVEALQRRLDQGLDYFRDDGFFTAYAGFSETADLAALVGPPKHATTRLSA